MERRFNRRLFVNVDWALALLVGTIVALGLSTVHSATSSPTQTHWSPTMIRQAAFAGAGTLLAAFIHFVDYRKLERYAYVIYGFTLALLVLVPVLGVVGGGSRRWIDLGPFALQPSEIVKVGLIVVLARFFHRDAGKEVYGLKDVLLPLVLFLVPAALILVQPDLGSAVLLGFVFASLVMVAGLRTRTALWLGVAAIVGIVGAGNALWSHLKPYQQKRILTFLDPTADPLGAGYHIIQSEIAVGSGGFWGKGYRNGTQNRLNFLPEQHTDFIFAVYAEERGFAGSVVLIALYLMVCLRCLQIVARAKDRFGALLAFGVGAMIFWQAFVNMSMAMGLMPVVGITLPFFSYGGSSMLTLLLGIGLVMNVSMRRYMF
jgi:rod shape determining protein RodA